MQADARLLRGWRVATAVRVFGLALATGQTLSGRLLETLGILLVALGVLATAASLTDLSGAKHSAGLIPAAEGLLAAVLLGTAETPANALLPYLIVAPVVAGIRVGWLGTVNATLATTAGLAGSWFAVTSTTRSIGATAASAWPWLVIGLGAGLLATWQSRSVRALEEAQAPYIEAHRLLSSLREVSSRLNVALDSATVAQELVRELVKTDDQLLRVAVWVRDSRNDAFPLAESGFPTASTSERGIIKDLITGKLAPDADSPFDLLPISIGEQAIGMVALRPERPLSGTQLDHASGVVMRFAVPLHSALLFEDIRSIATAEERNRLARDIHDGVAQDVASLGYLVDDLAASTDQEEVRNIARLLRSELTRVVAELRHSIFDLRHGLDSGEGLVSALEEFAEHIRQRSTISPHLRTDVANAAPADWIQVELLRIAQEAVANVRKHAHAENVWISFDCDTSNRFTLVVEDDGLGFPQERQGHYGLQSMKERATQIGATLTISPRSGGGTRVKVATFSRDDQGSRRVDHDHSANYR